MHFPYSGEQQPEGPRRRQNGDSNGVPFLVLGSVPMIRPDNLTIFRADKLRHRVWHTNAHATKIFVDVVRGK